jgi:hypothetical protein
MVNIYVPNSIKIFIKTDKKEACKYSYDRLKKATPF